MLQHPDDLDPIVLAVNGYGPHIAHNWIPKTLPPILEQEVDKHFLQNDVRNVDFQESLARAQQQPLEVRMLEVHLAQHAGVDDDVKEVHYSSAKSWRIGQGILALSERIYQCVTGNQPEDDLHELLHNLMTYADEHFRTEEAFLEEHRYPLLDEHKRQHSELYERLVDFVMSAAVGHIRHAEILSHTLY